MSEKNKVAITIGGKDYTLMGVKPKEYLQEIAHYVDKRLNEIINTNRLLSNEMAAVLTALNVVDEYFQTSDREEVLQEDIEIIKEENEILREENEMLKEQLRSLKVELSDMSDVLDTVTKP